jgi:hypothetical protein
MDATQITSLVTGISGALLGSAALAISILTYRRDEPRLKVVLQWDMTKIGRGRPDEMIGLVRVTNTGRRPVHIGAVALALPPNLKHEFLMLNDAIQGTRLEEGQPAGFTVNYDGLAQYKTHWDKIRAMATDSTGKTYYSEYPKKKPSWAN